MSKHTGTDLILEDMNAKFGAVVEVIVQIHGEMADFARKSDIQELKDEIKTIGAVVTDQSKQLSDHHRLTVLETPLRITPNGIQS